jgi:SAM-dependent methyltransferase
LLDTDSGTTDEIAASLADLERIARWFGGASTLAALIARVAERSGSRYLSVLDVGAGSGDLMRLARERLRPRGIELAVTLLDRSAAHLTQKSSAVALAGDALALPFREISFDLVACSTFAHHLEPNEIILFVNRALAIAKEAVLINDLRRSAAHLALVYMGFPLFRSRLTRHDGPASVRRAYTVEEMRGILQQTAAARIEISNHYLYRMGAIAWVK